MAKISMVMVTQKKEGNRMFNVFVERAEREIPQAVRYIRATRDKWMAELTRHRFSAEVPTAEDEPPSAENHYQTGGYWVHVPELELDGVTYDAFVLDGIAVIRHGEDNFSIVHAPTNMRYAVFSDPSEARAVAHWLDFEYSFGKLSKREIGELTQKEPLLKQVAMDGLSVLPEHEAAAHRLVSRRKNPRKYRESNPNWLLSELEIE